MADDVVRQSGRTVAIESRADRSQTILTALRKELEQRKGYLNEATDIVEVTLTVKLQAGTSWVRGIVWQEERRPASRP